MVENGVYATQGQVSRWLAEVSTFIGNGGTLPQLMGKPDSVDPAVIDMGARCDGQTPRQRLRRDPGSDDD